ncbi:MAG: hypothetical protein ACP5NZ_04275 [Nanobdellota archaeon]
MDFNIGPPKIEDKNKGQEYLLKECMRKIYDEISDNYTGVHEARMDSKMENKLKALSMKKGLN